MSIVIQSNASALGPSRLGNISDALFINLVAGFSVRETPGYSGPVIRGRNTSTNLERDFSEKELYDGTLESFGNGSDVTVILWYNQGSGPNMDTGSVGAQPTIVAGGAPLLRNNRLYLSYDGTNDYMAAVVNVAQPFTVSTTGAKAPSKFFGYIFEARDVGVPEAIDGHTVAMLTHVGANGPDFYTGQDLFGGTPIPAADPFSFIATAQGTSSFIDHRGGSYSGTGGPYGVGTLIVAANQFLNPDTYQDIGMQEILLFNRVMSIKEQQTLMDNNKEYFGI